MNKQELREFLVQVTKEFVESGGRIKHGRPAKYKNITWPPERMKDSIATHGRLQSIQRNSAAV